MVCLWAGTDAAAAMFGCGRRNLFYGSIFHGCLLGDDGDDATPSFTSTAAGVGVRGRGQAEGRRSGRVVFKVGRGLRGGVAVLDFDEAEEKTIE